MTCLDRSHPPCSYWWDGAQYDVTHVSGFGGEDGGVL
jgi:hypothetical protein